MDALPHFAVGNDGCDSIIFRDFHPSRNQMLAVFRDIFGQLACSIAGTYRNTDNKCTACKNACANETAPCPTAFLLFFFDFFRFCIFVCSFGHGYAPFAAVLMAARMRGYIPQRQTLPDMAASISSSVGFGVSRNNATALIICPDWQYPHCGT